MLGENICWSKMEALISNQNHKTTHWILVLMAMLFFREAESSCALSVTELWAYNNPSVEHFKDTYKQYITSDKGSKCQWLILSSHKEDVVELHFPDFNLKNTSGKKEGDCVSIYDGPSSSDQLIQRFCSSVPRRSFVSSDRELLVIYERGEVDGDRSFSMSFKSKDVLNKEKMIRIAGIIGACIAAVVLVFIILRATRCCRLFKSKSDQSPADIGGSTLVLSARERDRLTNAEGGSEASVDSMRREARRVQGSQASLNRLSEVPETYVAGRASTAATHSAPLAVAETEVGQGRDPGGGEEEGASSGRTGSSSSSRGDEEHVDELPPSYESLFLNEAGDYPVEKPPDYTPPKHKRKHPPRRVHTFN